jgi:putative flavoprotein involved in K+ transport
MANYQIGHIPSFATELDPGIEQLHSSRYKNPSQLKAGTVLVVGAANSGVDIAMDLARSHTTWLSGRHPGHVPFRLEGISARLFVPMYWLFINHVQTIDTPVGRRARRILRNQGGVVVRVKPDDLKNAGIMRTPRMAGVKGGLPLLEDGRTLAVENVVWCTGYRTDFSWIDIPVFDDRGEPIHERGVVRRVPGMYFVGLFFLYALGSTAPGGVGRDAKYIAKHLKAVSVR